MVETRERLPVATLLTYALPSVGTGFMFLLVLTHLMKFATDVLLIAPATIGILFALTRVWDAVSDPLAGYLSDRTRSRLGRRRSWMAASALPIAVSFWWLWSPPEGLEGGALTAWVIFGAFAFLTAHTLLQVPHLALGAELSPSHHERTRIFGVYHMAAHLGSILALAGMFVLAKSSDARATASHLSIIGAIATAAFILFAVARLRERPDYQDRGSTRPFGVILDVLRNHHARILFGVFMLSSAVLGLTATIVPYYAEYVLGDPMLKVGILALAIVPVVVTIPAWFPLSRRFGKARLYAAALLVGALSYGGFFFAGPGDASLVLALALVIGISNGCAYTMSSSLIADAIDYDESQTGERKEGSYFAGTTLLRKMAMGAVAVIAGAGLQLAGFVPNVGQTADVQLSIRCMFGLIPLGLLLPCVFLMLRFRIDEREHARVRAAIDSRA